MDRFNYTWIAHVAYTAAIARAHDLDRALIATATTGVTPAVYRLARRVTHAFAVYRAYTELAARLQH